MRDTWSILAVAASAIAVAALACSSGSSGSGGGTSCLSSQSGSTCYACDQSHCGSQLGTVESDCSDFLNCLCAGGSYNPSNVQSCASKITSSCNSANSALASCQQQSCASQCASSASGSSSGGSGSSSGSTTSGVSCLIANDPTIGGPVCYVLQPVGQTTAQLTTQCTATGGAGLGGMVVASCPTANLVGCCQSMRVSPAIECVYTGTQASHQNDCAGGWMSSP